MFGLTLPRLISTSLLIAYLKQWTILFVVAYFIMAILLLYHPHVKRGSAKDDPGQAFLGVLTNIFSPCIVIQEGSKFLAKSSILATLHHCLSLAVLLFVIVSSTMTIKRSANPPVLHCFPAVDNVTTKSTFERCLIRENQTSNCTEGMLHSDGNNKYATFCNGIEWWLPLVIVCATLMVFLLLTLPLTFWLDRLLDPINLTIASKSCLGCCLPHPSGYLPPVWNGEE